MTESERLLRVADVLDTVTPECLMMRAWVCGSGACAVGHAASDPLLREEGLKLERVGERAAGMGAALVPIYSTYKFWVAVEKFFGLSGDDAMYLFSPDLYEIDPPPAAVAARIREFVAT